MWPFKKKEKGTEEESTTQDTENSQSEEKEEKPAEPSISSKINPSDDASKQLTKLLPEIDRLKASQ